MSSSKLIVSWLVVKLFFCPTRHHKTSRNSFFDRFYQWQNLQIKVQILLELLASFCRVCPLTLIKFFLQTEVLIDQLSNNRQFREYWNLLDLTCKLSNFLPAAKNSLFGFISRVSSDELSDTTK